jgi:hypothetical protein
MSPELPPREPNVYAYSSVTPEGLVVVGGNCLGLDISIVLRLTVSQSEKLRKSMEESEKLALNFLEQARKK